MSRVRTPPEMGERAKRQARKMKWSNRVGRPLFTLLGSTWRVEEVNAEPWRALTAEGKPFILSMWHGNLMAAVWANRFRNMAALASTHGDAEIISRMMSQWGYHMVRGSSSEGGKRALADMIDAIRGGYAFAITPDGPRGPAGVPKPGVLVASVRSGAPIVGLRTEVSAKWRLKSWDRFELPKPFAKVRLIYADPWLPTSTSDDATAELVRRMGPAHATLMPPHK